MNEEVDQVLGDNFRFPENGLSAPGKTLFIGKGVKGGKEIRIQCKKVIVGKECSIASDKFWVECQEFLNHGSIRSGKCLFSTRRFVSSSGSRIDCREMIVNSDFCLNCGSIMVSQKIVVESKESLENRGMLASRDLMVIRGKTLKFSSGTVLGVRESHFFCSELNIRTKNFYHRKLFILGNLQRKTVCSSSGATSCSRFVISKTGRLKCVELKCWGKRFTNNGVVIVEKLFVVEKSEVFSNFGSVSTGMKNGKLVIVLSVSSFFNRGVICSKIFQFLGKNTFVNRAGGTIVCSDLFCCGKRERALSEVVVVKRFWNDGIIDAGKEFHLFSKNIGNTGKITGLTMSFGGDYEDSTTERSVRDLIIFEEMQNYGLIGDEVLCKNVNFCGKMFFNGGDVKSSEVIQLNLNKGFCSFVLKDGFIENIKSLICENSFKSRMILVYSPFVLTVGLKIYCNTYTEASMFALKGLSLNVMNLRNVVSLVSVDLGKLNIPNVGQLIQTFRHFPALLEDICVNNVGIAINVALNFFLDLLKVIVVSKHQYLFLLGVVQAGFNALCFLPSTFASVYDVAIHFKTLPFFRIIAFLSSVVVYGKMVAFSVVEGCSSIKIADGIRSGIISKNYASKMLIQNSFGSVRGILSYFNHESSVSCLSLDGFSLSTSLNHFNLSCFHLPFGAVRTAVGSRTTCIGTLGVGNTSILWNHGETSLTRIDFFGSELSRSFSLDNGLAIECKGRKVLYGGIIRSNHFVGISTDLSLHSIQCLGNTWENGKYGKWVFCSCIGVISNTKNAGVIEIPSNDFFRLRGDFENNWRVRGNGIFSLEGNISGRANIFQGNLSFVHDGKVLTPIAGEVETFVLLSTDSREYFFDLLDQTGVFSNFVVSKSLSCSFIGKLDVDRQSTGRVFEKSNSVENPLVATNLWISATGDISIKHKQLIRNGSSLCCSSSTGDICVNEDICVEGNIVLFSETGNVIRKKDVTTMYGDVSVLAPNGMDCVFLKTFEGVPEYVNALAGSAHVYYKTPCSRRVRLLIHGLLQISNTVYDLICNGPYDERFEYERFEISKQRISHKSRIGLYHVSKSSSDFQVYRNSVLPNSRYRLFLPKVRKGENVIQSLDIFEKYSTLVGSFLVDLKYLKGKFCQWERVYLNSKRVCNSMRQLLRKSFAGNDEIDLWVLREDIMNGEVVLFSVERREIDFSVKITSNFGMIQEKVAGFMGLNASYVCPNGQISIVATNFLFFLGHVRREFLKIEDWFIDNPMFVHGIMVGVSIYLECAFGGIHFSNTLFAEVVELHARNISITNEVDTQIETKTKNRVFFREKTVVIKEIESCVVHHVNRYSIECDGDFSSMGIEYINFAESEEGVSNGLSVKCGGNVVFGRRILTTKSVETSLAVVFKLPFMKIKEGRIRMNIVTFYDRMKFRFEQLFRVLRTIQRNGVTLHAVLESLLFVSTNPFRRQKMRSGMRIRNYMYLHQVFLNEMKNLEVLRNSVTKNSYRFEIGISLRYSVLKKWSQSLGEGSISTSLFSIETPENVFFRNNLSIDVDECSIVANGFLFDSADLKRGRTRKVMSAGVSFKLSKTDGAFPEIQNVIWRFSASCSESNTVWHRKTYVSISNVFSLDVESCILEGVRLKCKELIGSVGKLEFVTLQETEKYKSLGISLGGTKFFVRVKTLGSKLNTIWTTIDCEDWSNLSVKAVGNPKIFEEYYYSFDFSVRGSLLSGDLGDIARSLVFECDIECYYFGGRRKKWHSMKLIDIRPNRYLSNRTGSLSVNPEIVLGKNKECVDFAWNAVFAETIRIPFFLSRHLNETLESEEDGSGVNSRNLLSEASSTERVSQIP